MKIIVYNSDKHKLIKEVDLIVRYCQFTFPGDTYIVESFAQESEMIRDIFKSRADIYLISAIGEDEKSTCFLRLGKEIRLRQRDSHLMFVIDKPTTLYTIVKHMLSPNFIIENEVTESQLKAYFSIRRAQSMFGNILAFTSENKKKMINMRMLLFARSEKKHVILRTSSKQYVTSLTISYLEEVLPKCFIRIDKGTLINGDYIKKYDIETEMIHMMNGERLFVSRRGRQRLYDAFGI